MDHLFVVAFPFFENLNFLYLKLVPIILIFLFVYLVIKTIDLKSKINSYILTLILMNPGKLIHFGGEV